ncbi:hypothetical protein BOX37_30250 [Nocardia mangyaensis]|uniref:Uncharacterized protein n=1 Tax=Nocardia mangyaensis TaxID=2213200 RepID=A0A1J0VZR7_9NOCA|nr:hypothetical protein [Nocardia mangyaensis]APE37502.1 hypothetical protein BOX37_30250 [Nocardia mangyaensis]
MGRLHRGGRWALGAVGMVVTLAFVLAAARFLWPQPGIEAQPGATERQLAFVRAALDDGADTAAQRQFPEGHLFLNALYGIAWVQAAHTDPQLREEALREARWALDRMESEEGKAVFSAELQPAHGVFWAGWTNWLRGAILSLDATDSAEVQRFSEHSTALAQAFTEARTPFLQAYPGQAWPVDSTVAIASLRLHDHLLGNRFTRVTDRWVAQVQERLDPATNLIPHQVSPQDGSPRTGARATSQAMIHRFLPEIDPAFAAAQYARYRDLFVAYPGGFGPAVREYPHGVDGRGDVDSGPLVAGVSLSATVVGLGAARVNGDGELAAAIGAEGELLGLPISLPGTKRYAFGALPIGDAFVVWSSTARLLTATHSPIEHDLRWWWRLPWLIGIGLLALAPWTPALLTRLRRHAPGQLPTPD